MTAGSGLLATILLVAAAGATAPADERDRGYFDPFDKFFFPGNLVVSRTLYDDNPHNVAVGAILPPGCESTTGGCSAASGAPFDGSYPFVWSNDLCLQWK